MKKDASYWIEKLQLMPHPEGGYFSEFYRSKLTTRQLKTGESRNLSTSIYFLLAGDQKSHFHELDSDELWYFHDGTALDVHIFENGIYRMETLGLDMEKGQTPQLLLPAQSVFGAALQDKSSFCLMGCVVSPGFDFEDFRLCGKEELVTKFPDQSRLIEEFTLVD